MKKYFLPLFCLILLGTVTASNNAQAACGDGVIDAGEDCDAGPSNGLVGWWKFDGNALDSSVNGNNGTLVGGPNFTAGQIDQAVDLNGTSQYVDVGAPTTLNNLPALSISAWIKPDSLWNNPGNDIVAKTHGETPTFTGWLLRTENLSGDHNSLYFSADFNKSLDSWDFDPFQDLIAVAEADVIQIGEWNHVVVTWDGSKIAANVKFYVNGVLVNHCQGCGDWDMNGVGTRSDDSYRSLIIGDDAQSKLVQPFDGLIDDIRIYNRVLSASEVATLDSQGLGGATCSSLGFNGGTLSCNTSTCKFNTSQCTPKGNIIVSATLDGQPWPASGSGAVTYTLSGPLGDISNSTVPFTYSNVPANVNYTLNYVSGGPASAALDSVTPISPISSQLLPQNSTIVFTINFKSTPLPISVSCSAFPTSIKVGESSRWIASASGGTGGPYTYTWSGTDNLSGVTNSPINYIDHTYLSVNTNPGHSASVNVSDGSQSKNAVCANTVQGAPVVGADLTGRALGINGNRVPGQAITFAGDVFNFPGKNTSAPSTSRICIDNANCLTSTTGSLGEFSIPALSANTNSVPFNTSNTWTMTLGTHTYYVCADVYGTNSETDETNNCGSQTFTATECSDGVDNIDPEDNLIDAADPGCHTDANASNPASYNALDDNEANSACSDPFDNDGDGANNCADPGCHTDHNYKNSSSCDPSINNEFYVTQCEDVDALGAPIDNDGDGKANSADPGCHWDGNVNNPNSYDKYDNNESDLSFREVFKAFTRPFASLFGF